MKNPLRKRIPRELRTDFGKYLVIFLLMVLMISMASGYMVAGRSMSRAYWRSFEDYTIENGHFSLKKLATPEEKERMEELGIQVYDLFYRDTVLENDTTLRLYALRDQVNLVCLMEGALPEKPGEMGIDRMYAQNNGLKVGDTVGDGTSTWTITGLVALSDYSCLFENNSDAMFDAVRFGVSVISREEFDTFDVDGLEWNYAWLYDTQPEDTEQEMEMSLEVMRGVQKIIPMETFVPRYQNQAIIFTGDDIDGDQVMMEVFLYILIVILAFVFAITISNTIVKEASVIGTLRATGYTRQELIRHYMAMPVLVTLISAVVGNIIGYTKLRTFVAYMYYRSYSLPTYVTIWNGEAFMKTTLIPLAMMVVITWVILRMKLSLSPMRFLRRDLGRGRSRSATRLAHGIPFFTRFRLRVLLQNAGNYLVMLLGIFFASFLLMFGLIFPSILNHYQDTIQDNMICQYQYILKVPLEVMSTEAPVKALLYMSDYLLKVQTENPDAEKFSAYSLQTLNDGKHREEEVLFYGIEPGSRYVNLDFQGDEVYVSSGYAAKHHLSEGDTFTLREEFGDETYSFTVGGVYDYQSSLAVFMDRSALNKRFDLSQSYFAGYFSDTEISDVDEKYIGTVIDEEELTKISRQLILSMGSFMYIFVVGSLIIFMILIYLLSKVIIERNAQAISMAKILGYENREISRLYLLPTSILVLVFLVACLPLEVKLLDIIFDYYIGLKMTGWFDLWYDPGIFVKIVVLGAVTYLVVALLEYRRIRRVPMEEALKNVE